MSGAFAAAVRERARLARAAVLAARRDQDPDEALVAEAEWEHVTRLARTHGIRLAEPEPAEAEPAEAEPAEAEPAEAEPAEPEPAEPERGERP
ncbi:hypothetical protein [Nonomuraea sp. KM90]|uniref:hypothetical protein n=1 Tax=Nonomuraea sp. KM90 TaxID=3457428 RepID=UPI003FCD2AD2